MLRRGLIGILFFAAAWPAAVILAQGPGPAIAQLKIAVFDLGAGREVGEYSPGETLRLEVGQRMRLRMIAVPAAPNRPRRYPATRFSPLAGTGRIDVNHVNESQGSAVVEGIRTNNPGNNAATTLVRYEILDPINIRRGVVKGTITIQVVEAPPRPFDRSPPPNRGREWERPGVTLYEHQDFHGESETFHENDPRLADSLLGQDSASSVRVDLGCKVVLYQHSNYGGRATVLTEDEVDLRGSRVGNDSASSLEIDCRGARFGRRRGSGGRPGVTLYEDRDFRGENETFHNDDRRLRDNPLGDDRASSVRVDHGCRAVLYRDPGFRGRATVVTEDVADLGDTRIGNDRVSSIEVRCN